MNAKQILESLAAEDERLKAKGIVRFDGPVSRAIEEDALSQFRLDLKQTLKDMQQTSA
jgi:hypothetical protein